MAGYLHGYSVMREEEKSIVINQDVNLELLIDALEDVEEVGDMEKEFERLLQEEKDRKEFEFVSLPK